MSVKTARNANLNQDSRAAFPGRFKYGHLIDMGCYISMKIIMRNGPFRKFHLTAVLIVSIWTFIEAVSFTWILNFFSGSYF